MRSNISGDIPAVNGISRNDKDGCFYIEELAKYSVNPYRRVDNDLNPIFNPNAIQVYIDGGDRGFSGSNLKSSVYDSHLLNPKRAATNSSCSSN